MRRTLRERVAERKSAIEGFWPPKWFLSYADLATLLMTFFVVLATMLALKIPLYALADKRAQAMIKKAMEEQEEMKRLTDRERTVYGTVKDLEFTQIQSVLEIDKMEDFYKAIVDYIKRHNLEPLINVQRTRFKVVIIPKSSFFFDEGKATLKPQTKEFLDTIEGFLEEVPSFLTIEGHTDNTPVIVSEYSSNWELSVARANSIFRYLVEKKGIPISRITAVGYGASRPAFPNDTEEHRAQNRRVVMEISPEIVKDVLQKYLEGRALTQE